MTEEFSSLEELKAQVKDMSDDEILCITIEFTEEEND